MEKLKQTLMRRSTPQTKAGQYMCPECGKIFETKKEIDRHVGIRHEDQRMLFIV